MARYFEENNIVIQKEAGDDEILLNNTVDFISFSHYMSVTKSASAGLEETTGNLTGGVKNPYLEASGWGWEIDPIGLRVTAEQLTRIVTKNHCSSLENGLGAYDKG